MVPLGPYHAFVPGIDDCSGLSVRRGDKDTKPQLALLLEEGLDAGPRVRREASLIVPAEVERRRPPRRLQDNLSPERGGIAGSRRADAEPKLDRCQEDEGSPPPSVPRHRLFPPAEPLRLSRPSLSRPVQFAGLLKHLAPLLMIAGDRGSALPIPVSRGIRSKMGQSVAPFHRIREERNQCQDENGTGHYRVPRMMAPPCVVPSSPRFRLGQGCKRNATPGPTPCQR